MDGVERRHSSSHNLSRINPIREAQPTRLLRIEPRPRFVHLLPVGRDPIYQALHRAEQAFPGHPHSEIDCQPLLGAGVNIIYDLTGIDTRRRLG